MPIKSKSGEILLAREISAGDTVEYSVLIDVDFSRYDLEGVYFAFSDLSGASFEEANLYWLIFFRATLKRASFSGSLIRGCDFKKADLENANFCHAKIIRDNVGGFSDFRGANLSGAIFTGAIIEAACFDDTTIAPLNIDLEEIGFSRSQSKD